MYLNRVEIAGYLAKKPEVRYLPSGTPVANARLGQTQKYQDGNQQTQEHTNWHNLSFYGDLSKVALTLEKGDNLYVGGSIEQRQFTPKDGVQRTVTEIVVKQCHLIAPPRSKSSGAKPVEEVPAAPVNGHANDTGSEVILDDSWPIR
jgi:single-strand DNA-binding protein